MKQNKLFNGLILLLIVLLNSCSDNYIEIKPSETTNSSNGIKISEEIAEIVALNFYSNTYKGKEHLNKSNNQTLNIQSIEIIKDYNNETAIYSINIEPNGFVLVSSNSKNVPIVAHSENGTFEFNENSPDALKSWLSENIIFNDVLESKDPIEEIEWQWYLLSENRMPYPGDGNNDNEEGGDGSNGESSDHTVRYSHTVTEQFGPLMQTTWNQFGPYNYYTPNNNPTGCVAVATAQIMRYHEWPNTFNWSIMPNDPNSWNTNAGSLEIASLMSDVGVNVDMEYSASGSGAQSEDARDALVNNYGYSSTANYSSYDFFTVQQNIKWGYPVYMSGCRSYETHGTWFWEYTTYQNCHAWVCDGYKQQYDVYIHNEGTQYEYTQSENSYEWLHMNWGWGSSGDAWFYKNHIYIHDVFISGVHPNYQYNRNCIYNIKQ